MMAKFVDARFVLSFVRNKADSLYFRIEPFVAIVMVNALL